jgi:membrane protein
MPSGQRAAVMVAARPSGRLSCPAAPGGRRSNAPSGEFQVDNLSDWAAALTYYSVLSIFPALLVLISLVDLAGPGTIQTLLDNLGQVAPGSVNQILATAIENLQQTRGSAGVLALVSLATALWLASRYIAAFMRASNAIYDVPEGRPV